MENALGKHFIVELYGCNGNLGDATKVRTIMREAANKCKATIVSDYFHQFEPWGVSGVIILAESHISIHTWPERKYAAVDFFFCDAEIDVDAGISVLSKKFNISRHSKSSLDRGLFSQIAR